MAAIVESVNDPIIAIDKKKRITVWNNGAEDLYGYTAAEVLGGPVDILSLAHLKPVQAANAEISLSGRCIRAYETQKIKKNGDIVQISANGSPIFNKDGDVIGSVGIHRDVTDQKKAERAARESEERFNVRLLEEKARAEEIQIKKTQQLQTIFEIAQVLAGPTDLQTKAEAVSNMI